MSEMMCKYMFYFFLAFNEDQTRQNGEDWNQWVSQKGFYPDIN